MHSVAVHLHRWVGLATALFLAVAGLTGTVLVFKNELEAALNPAWFIAPPPPGRSDTAFLDPFALRDHVQRLFPDARVDHMSFPVPGVSQMFYLMPRIDPSTGASLPLRVDQAYLDPYTGDLLGARKWGELFTGGRFHRENIVPFIWRLHEALALPFPWGKWFMGAVALLWTFDCFVGAYLTWPRSRPFVRKWAIAWRIKLGASCYRTNLDLHRAAGLWLWALLLVFAWSSVMLNLRTVVYEPVMSLAFNFRAEPQPRLQAPRLAPQLDFRNAHEKARQALDTLAREKGFTVLGEDSLWYRPGAGAYMYRTRTSLDVRDAGAATDLWIDGNSGQVLLARFEGRGANGDVMSSWLRVLHIGQIGGWYYRLVVAVIGIVLAGLGVTGVIIWRVKRRARQMAHVKRARQGPAHRAGATRRLRN